MAVSISLSGKVALVTGGGRGIGRAITERLVEAGADVAIASRKLDVLEAAAAEIRAQPGEGRGRVLPIECHVGKPEDIERAVATCERELGPVDVLVNNSVTNIGQGPSLQADAGMLAKMVEVNVASVLRLVNRCAPSMIERGGGSIINLASISGLQPQAGGLLYSFTKSGLIMMTRSWARELGPHGIRVNAIAPGLIQTDFSTYFWKDEARRAELVGDQPIRKLGQPRDIGFAAVWLASDESSFVTGHTLVIDGGATA
ncbi:MAG TPA: SDR family oxidoreductase [Nannocystaceae bacterium]|nr:SDR family oxidoreductase [Nannocystaceae bacterium]